ncbi:MAG: phospholipase [Chlorobiales bacterium]|nr:phospholipase [Chlorobiales bacterium]
MTNASLSLFHLTHEPRERTDKKPPLLVLLHGYGSNEQDLIQLAPELDPRFFIVSPRAPMTIGPEMHAWFHIEFIPTGITVDLQQAAAARQMLIGFIDELITAYPVDPAQVFLMGFSQGAVMTYTMVFSQPEKFAGAVVMSGQMPPQSFLERVPVEKLRDFPIFVAHGVFDEVLPVKLGREGKKYLESLPVKFVYHEYPMGHQVSLESMADISAWLTNRLNANQGDTAC